MKLMSLLDCIDRQQDIEIYVSDLDTGYMSQRQYYGTKRHIQKYGLLNLEVNSVDICHYSDRECSLRIILLSNQW